MKCTGWWLPLFFPALSFASDPAWMEQAQALCARGQARTALAQLAALPLAVRQSTDYHWELAQVAIGCGETRIVAEAHTLLTALLPGCTRSLASLPPWLSARAAELYTRALAARSTALYGAAVEADGAILGRPDAGLAALTRDSARAALARPTTPANERDLGWQLYLLGDVLTARSAFAAAARDPDPYGSWLATLWLKRLDAEAASAKQADQEYEARRASASREEDRKREAAERLRAETRQTEQAEAQRAEAEATRARRREIDRQIRAMDREIQFHREKEMLPLRQPGVDPRLTYDVYQEHKAQENALKEKKRQLEAERDSLSDSP
jgi:hypothetical protein